MTLRIHCLQHVEFHGRAYLPEWAAAVGYRWQRTLVPEADSFPQLGDLDALIVIGGPMSVWEDAKYSWLREEKRFIERVIAAGKPVLGICLGAQLIAELLGGKAYVGEQKEIGWYRVETTAETRDTWVADVLPPQFETFFWHGDTFDLPTNAVRIARSAAYENQGFIYERVVGLQFHLEVTPDWVKHLATRDADQLVKAPFIQSSGEMLGKAETSYAENNAWMERLLESWLAPLASC